MSDRSRPREPDQFEKKPLGRMDQGVVRVLSGSVKDGRADAKSTANLPSARDGITRKLPVSGTAPSLNSIAPDMDDAVKRKSTARRHGVAFETNFEWSNPVETHLASGSTIYRQAVELAVHGSFGDRESSPGMVQAAWHSPF